MKKPNKIKKFKIRNPILKFNSIFLGVQALIYKLMTINVYADRMTSGFNTQSSADNLVSKLNAFLQEYKMYINFIFGIVILSNIAIFIIHFMKLSYYSTESKARKECIRNILISGFCLILTCGAGTLYAFFVLFYFK